MKHTHLGYASLMPLTEPRMSVLRGLYLPSNGLLSITKQTS